MPAARKTEMPQSTSGSTVNMQISDRKGPRAPVMHRHRQLPNRRLAVDCLRSLSAQADSGRTRVIVADNASGDVTEYWQRRADNGWSGWAEVWRCRATATACSSAMPARGGLGSTVRPITCCCSIGTLVRPGAISAGRLHGSASTGRQRHLLESDSGGVVVRHRTPSPSANSMAARLGPLSRHSATRYRRRFARRKHECDWSRAPA